MKVQSKRVFWGTRFHLAVVGFFLSVFLIFGCGGGGSSGGDGGGGNQAPVADASAPSPVDELSSVNLNGTLSTDGDGAIASYAWSQVGGAPTVVLNNANSSIASFTAPAVAAQTDLTFRLTVTDDDGATDSADVTVTIDIANNVRIAIADGTPDQVNLEVEGTVDWMHWGLIDETSVNEKNGGTELQDFEIIPNPAAIPNFGDFAFNTAAAVSWTNGTGPDVTDTTKTIFFPNPDLNVGEGISLVVPADVNEKTLKLYLGLYGARAKLRAYLGDSGAPDAEAIEFIENPLEMTKFKTVTVDFGAAGAGQDLTIEYTLEQVLSGSGDVNLALQAATLAD